jgi:hypothetical protein
MASFGLELEVLDDVVEKAGGERKAETDATTEAAAAATCTSDWTGLVFIICGA